MAFLVKDNGLTIRGDAHEHALATILPETPAKAQNEALLAARGEDLAKLALDTDGQYAPLDLGHNAVEPWQEDALLLRITPLAAAYLGEKWADDSLSFVDVSIASARLQELVRRMGVRASNEARTPAIPVVVPPWEQHALAAALTAHRVCRAGRRAVLVTDANAERLARMPLVKAAPALLVCTAEYNGSARATEFARALRSGLRTSAPIIVGGPSFSSAYIDTGLSSGALWSANDPVAALRACDIELSELE